MSVKLDVDEFLYHNISLKDVTKVFFFHIIACYNTRLLKYQIDYIVIHEKSENVVTIS